MPPSYSIHWNPNCPLGALLFQAARGGEVLFFTVFGRGKNVPSVHLPQPVSFVSTGGGQGGGGACLSPRFLLIVNAGEGTNEKGSDWLYLLTLVGNTVTGYSAYPRRSFEVQPAYKVKLPSGVLRRPSMIV